MRPLVTKAFEIRDSPLSIPVIATQLASDEPKEAWLLMDGSFGGTRPLVMVYKLRLDECTFLPCAWRARTMQTAHQYIEDHFNDLATGSVIDVQFILGETATPKVSERGEG